MKGKVVLFVTWASWYKTSLEAVKISQSLHEKLADKGLIVVGVHHAKGYEKAVEVAKAQNVAFAYALDAQNEFRKALYSKGDPDFYIVDRAGNLRYADVETASVETAVNYLIDESAESAAAAKPETKPTENAAKPDDKQGDGAAGGGAPGNYQQPDAAAYKAAHWPKANPKENLSAGDFQGKPLPKPLGKEKFIDNKRPDRAGRVTVLDFWATWCGPCKMAMPKLDKLQKENKDIIVIGISDEPENTVKTFLSKNKHSYAQATDQSATVNGALKIQGIPHVVVLSSDGMIRWQGNPLQGEFEQAVKAVVEADPGVKARRQADSK
jgi:thiol-disulfide isomerase/thioredoxin